MMGDPERGFASVTVGGYWWAAPGGAPIRMGRDARMPLPYPEGFALRSVDREPLLPR